MIVTVTLNASWDITYQVAGLRPGQAHRVTGVDERAGGKGLNVARVLHTIGQRVRVTGLVGGDAGRRIVRDLQAIGLKPALYDTGFESRRTVTVVDGGSATLLSEPGPAELDWSEYRYVIGHNFTEADVVVLAGSLPPGLPVTAYRDLTEDAHRAGARVILDADGPAGHAALIAGPELVKPNETELLALTGHTDPVAGAAALMTLGAGSVVVSLGADGMIGLDSTGAWQLPAVHLTPVNPTGAGDAAVAGLAVGLRAGRSLPELLVAATELAARAVLSPAAGELGPALVTPLPTARSLAGVEHA